MLELRTLAVDVYFEDAEPPKSKSNLRKGANPLRPSRRVRFAYDALRSVTKLERKPFLGVMVPTHPRERHFVAPKFEDRNQEDTLENQRMARAKCLDFG